MSDANSPLPIDDALPQLAQTLEESSFAVLVAAPGAGKTTRVPLALLKAAWRNDGKIIMLEPRRIAARAAAQRMAQTLDEKVGQTVGYRVRLDTRVSEKTKIEVVTEGVFTRMIMDDPELSDVAMVIFDEFHERSLDADLGLALALDTAILRPELRILVMSATLDTRQMSTLLQDSPLIESEGRAYPVQTQYVPSKPGGRIEDHVVSTVLMAIDQEEGSILVFLPGQAEIHRVNDRLLALVPDNIDVAPLYGRLTAEQQDKAISPASAGRRKVVLATSIAQTSLTIEGIRIVVDSGLSRVPVYEPATALTRLETRTISQASATQRQGRAGRTQAGVCYRLWSKGQNSAQSEFDTPEILAADLSSLVLNLAGWGVTDPIQMLFVDQPPNAAWSEATSLLRRLEAIDEKGKITKTGVALANLPVHPRLAHMINQGQRSGNVQLAANIAALISEHGLGGNSIDLNDRLRAFLSDKSTRARNAKDLASRWAKLSNNGAKLKHNTSVGELLAFAFPDRVAQAAGRPGRFRLANGRAATLPGTSALSQEDFIVVTDITGPAADGRIRAAARISIDEILDVFSGHIIDETRVEFDRASRSVRARKVSAIDQLILSDVPAKVESSEASTNALCEGILEFGVDALPWSKAQRALRHRVTYLNKTLGGPWPDLSDDALQESIMEWLPSMLGDVTALSKISVDILDAALTTILPWDLRSQINTLLPTHFQTPTGSRVPIDYSHEVAPVFEVRVQELFGLTKHPTIADGKIPLLVILLSPAHRPIQTTQDLPGFWNGSWQDVAKDLKGRYPKHYWPDDPVAAEATARAKPRK